MAESQAQKLTTILITLTIISLMGMIYVLFPRQVSDPIAPGEDQNKSQRALTSAPKYGSPTPKALFIEFGDFQCPACKTLSEVTQQLADEYSDTVQFVWIHAIDTINHPEARTAAIASQCASEQNQFKPFHDLLFENQDRLGPNLYAEIASELNFDLATFNACLVDQETLSIINDHQRFTEISRVTETPTVAINDQFVSDVLTYETLKTILDDQLAQ